MKEPKCLVDQKYNYCLKCDIRGIEKFYPSIRHDLLRRVIRSRIKDKEVLELLDDIID